MKQTRISKWLKGIVYVLALMGLLVFAGFTYSYHIRDLAPASVGFRIFFLWYTAGCFYLILFNFWGVCTEIGKDNSFSLENKSYFRHMAVCGLSAAVGFLGKGIFYTVDGVINLPLAGIVLAEIIVVLVFAVLCEALSQLIQNAYEVKHENELTI